MSERPRRAAAAKAVREIASVLEKKRGPFRRHHGSKTEYEKKHTAHFHRRNGKIVTVVFKRRARTHPRHYNVLMRGGKLRASLFTRKRQHLRKRYGHRESTIEKLLEKVGRHAHRHPRRKH